MALRSGAVMLRRAATRARGAPAWSAAAQAGVSLRALGGRHAVRGLAAAAAGKKKPAAVVVDDVASDGEGDDAPVEAPPAPQFSAPPPAAAHAPLLNPGTDLDMGWVETVRVNKNAVERRAGEIAPRRSVKKAWQAAWLLRAVTCIDLTTLAGDDTPGKVARMCAKARNPVRRDVLEMLLGSDYEAKVGKIQTGAVCVYPARVQDAVAALEGSGIPVASVATGFPSGQIKTEHKLAEIRQCVEDGAQEIDIVISRDLALSQDWKGIYDEVKLFREACGDAHMKTILATGELPTLKSVYQASLVCMMAGADFIKTSTGKEPFNATIPVSLVMVRAAREYLERTGYKVGFKPAGGISAAKQAMAYQAMMKDELGVEWTMPHLFRFGASSLLTDIERQLYHQATNEYARDEYFAMG